MTVFLLAISTFDQFWLRLWERISLHIYSWYSTLSWTQTGLDFDREIQNAKEKKREILVITNLLIGH